MSSKKQSPYPVQSYTAHGVERTEHVVGLVHPSGNFRGRGNARWYQGAFIDQNGQEHAVRATAVVRGGKAQHVEIVAENGQTAATLDKAVGRERLEGATSSGMKIVGYFRSGSVLRIIPFEDGVKLQERKSESLSALLERFNSQVEAATAPTDDEEVPF